MLRIELDLENYIRCAEAFLEAHKRCDPENEIVNPGKMGVPAIVCGAFACEVALKALIFLLHDKAAEGHDLYDLLYKLPGHLRVQIQEGTCLSVEKFDNDLQRARHAFRQWRYFYEDKEALLVNVAFLGTLASVVLAIIERMENELNQQIDTAFY